MGEPIPHGGNDVGFADLLRDGLGDGKPRGRRFREILADYVAMAGGGAEVPVRPPPIADRCSTPAAKLTPVNVPLEESDDERIRALVDLPRKFMTDSAALSPAAASYQRRRPNWFDDPKRVLEEWGVGYLPMDAGGSREGGTMRGKIVFPVRDMDGKILAFCGRDPGYEEKHRAWSALSDERKTQSPEPAKWRFPKNFHRGLELWGQERLAPADAGARLAAQGGLVVVEGPGDVFDSRGPASLRSG